MKENLFKRAKKIRKKGENWQDAIQRARQQSHTNQAGGGWGSSPQSDIDQSGGGWGDNWFNYVPTTKWGPVHDDEF